MTTHEDSATALSAMLVEAGATVCRSCGKQAAVRAEAFGRTGQPTAANNVTWICFECGHEDRRAN